MLNAFTSSTAFKTITWAATKLEKSANENLIIKNISGIGNILSGGSQIVVGIGMKCSDRLQVQSQIHIERGWKVLKKGTIDASLLIASTAIFLYIKKQ